MLIYAKISLCYNDEVTNPLVSLFVSNENCFSGLD